MAGRIIYLEVDDEITSAATRIRESDAARIAVVLPYGSRVATSRINFRLLSRDALGHDKRLAIVAGDAATRALAASAGLAVYSTVAEYEAAEQGVDDADEGERRSARSVAGAAVIAAGAGAVATPPGGVEATPPEATDSAAGADDASDGTLGLFVPGVAAGAAASDARGASAVAGDVPVDTVRSSAAMPAGAGAGAAAAGAGTWHPGPVGAARAGAGGRGRIRTSWLAGAGILALALLVGGVGLYLLLPSATIVVTPRPEPVGPIELTVVADPTATQPDPAAGIVPAEEISIPVEVEGTFAASGKRVEETQATGTVRFENRDPTSTNRIAAGSVVRTNSGVRFRTNVTITVPRAELVGLTIFPARASVGITAVEGGPEGNVEAGTIVIVPNDEPELFLKVTNLEPTSGGTRQEFTRVTQEDVDKAMASLETSLDAAFRAAMDDPSIAAGGATVFPSTGVLGEPTPTVPPDSLVGQEVASFDLGLSATGTVIAVDTAPVEAIAEQALAGAVEPEHELIDGSTDIDVGDAVVVGQTVSFPVTAKAEQIAILDPAELTALVLGKPIDEARAALEPYGEVEITVSPNWTGSVPSFESRVELTVPTAVEIETPAPSGSAAP